MKVLLRIPVLPKILSLNKRGKLVFLVLILTLGLFIFEFLGVNGLAFGLFLAVFTDVFLFLILRKDIARFFSYLPVFILPFLYTISFSLFYLLFPSRFFLKIIITIIYAFGLYSLFLTQNILVVSSNKTINLLRSARIVLFIITQIILFFLLNVIFLARFPIYIMPVFVFVAVFILNFQSLWFYRTNKSQVRDVFLYSFFLAFIMSEMSFIITVWPVNSTIYSIFLTGIFYVFSGMSHAWVEGRLFKGVLWEYIWVAFLSLLILFSFSNWGL